MKPMEFKPRCPADNYEYQMVDRLRQKGRSWQDVASAIGRSLSDTRRIHDPLLPVIVPAAQPVREPVPETIDNTSVGLMTKTALEVASRHGVTLEEIMGERRGMQIVRARWEFMALCSDAGRSTTQIGLFLQRDHTTIMHGVKRQRASLAMQEAA